MDVLVKLWFTILSIIVVVCLMGVLTVEWPLVQKILKVIVGIGFSALLIIGLIAIWI